MASLDQVGYGHMLQDLIERIVPNSSCSNYGSWLQVHSQLIQGNLESSTENYGNKCDLVCSQYKIVTRTPAGTLVQKRIPVQTQTSERAVSC